MNKMVRICEDCKYFDKFTCRRTPLQVVIVPPDYVKLYNPRTEWPFVDINDWCGEFERKPTD